MKKQQSPLVEKARGRLAAVRNFIATLVDCEALSATAAADCLRAIGEAENAIGAAAACQLGTDIDRTAMKIEIGLALESLLDEHWDPSDPRRDHLRSAFWTRIDPFFQPRLF